MDVIVDLNSLNKKQLLKEFKDVGKDVKSKDLDKRKIALDKISKTSRYLLEGDCFVPLLDSCIPKQVLCLISVISVVIFYYFIVFK